MKIGDVNLKKVARTAKEFTGVELTPNPRSLKTIIPNAGIPTRIRLRTPYSNTARDLLGLSSASDIDISYFP